MVSKKAKSAAKTKIQATKAVVKIEDSKPRCNIKNLCICKAIKGVLIIVGTVLGYWHHMFLLIPLLIGIFMLAKSFSCLYGSSSSMGCGCQCMLCYGKDKDKDKDGMRGL